MAVVGPLVFYLSWPWLWFDTGRRFADYVAFHTGHEYYNMEFLGRTYWKPPMPRLYAWLMTAATVPGITLLAFVLGVGVAARQAYLTRLKPLILRRARKQAPDPASPAAPVQVGAPSGEAALHGEFGTHVIWLLSILTSYAPWLSSDTPIFGGTKHWLTAYPFLCLFAASGIAVVSQKLRALVRERSGERLLRWPLIETGLFACAVAAPAAITLDSHPWGLSAYTPLVGGAPGAATLGLNRTFWGYATGSVAGFLNERAPPGASVYLHDTVIQSWDTLRADGRLRSDLRGSYTIHGSLFALYHHEPHMGRVEYQIWVDYGTSTPVHVATYDGVPVVWVYERPERSAVQRGFSPQRGSPATSQPKD
jgi:hypothetical protein